LIRSRKIRPKPPAAPVKRIRLKALPGGVVVVMMILFVLKNKLKKIAVLR
jgi:hypothetical protein